jgi:signal transduction histidine kinase
VWFQLLGILLAYSAIYLLYRVRLKHAASKIHALYEERLRERSRIGRELHDTLLQNICGLALQLDGWSKVVQEPPAAQEGLRELRREAEQWLHETRERVWDLRSQNEEGVPLADEVQQIGQQAVQGAPVELHVTMSGTDPGLPAETRTHLLRIAGEAVRNAVRHSGASEIRIEISYQGRDYLVRLRITDDGCGFPTEPASATFGHWGLITMRERAEKLGAEFKVCSTVGEGTEIEVTIPTVRREHTNSMYA